MATMAACGCCMPLPSALVAGSFFDGFFRSFLHVHIDGRINLETFFIDGIGPVFVNQGLCNVVNKMRLRIPVS